MRKIGILNLIEHLEETVEGFKNGLTQGEIEARYIYFNARGRENKLSGYAQKILKNNPDIIFACSTLSAIAVKDVMGSKCLPVIYAPIFNPSISGLVDSESSVLKNFTGVSGMIESVQKIDMMERVFTPLKKITLFFDPNDENSIFEQEKLTDEIKKRGLSCGIFPLSGGRIELQILNKIDSPVLLCFSLKIEEHLENWIDRAVELGVPVVASSKRGAVLGCLAGLYADHYHLGMIAAEKAVQVLNGTIPSDIPISYPKGCKVVCNYMTATALDFDFPQEISMMGDLC
jgi:putative ABC transport system substrate-binding protein